MFSIVVRLILLIIFLVVVILNTIYPAFRKDLPLFWMFRGRKIRGKYKEQFEQLETNEHEQRLVEELQSRTEDLRRRNLRSRKLKQQEASEDE